MGKKIIKRKRKTSGKGLPYDPYNVNITSSNPTTDQSAWIDKKKSKKSVKNKKQHKTINDMHVADLRVLARRYNVPSAGIKKSLLKKRIKSKMRDIKISDTSSFINTEEGSRTEVVFPDKQFNVTVIDVDVEPHTQVKTQRLGEGMYDIKQETVLGEEESVLVTVSHTDPMIPGLPPRSIPGSKISINDPVKLVKNRLLPVTIDFPASWDKDRKAEQQKIFNMYLKSNKPPIIKPMKRTKGKGKDKVHIPSRVPSTSKSPNFLESYHELIPKAKYLVEKKSMLKLLPINVSSDDVVTTEGQQLQNVISNNMNYQGIFFQDSTFINPVNHFARSETKDPTDLTIIVDNDNTGHYLAFMNNLYAYDNPFVKNTRFLVQGQLTEKKSPDELKAMKFWGENIVNSSAHRRNVTVTNKVLQGYSEGRGRKAKRIDGVLMKGALKYRDDKGKVTDFEISEQKLAIAHFLDKPKATLLITTPDRSFSLPFTLKDFDIKPTDNPTLEFIRDPKQKIKQLDSDNLNKMIVNKFGLEPDAAQTILESLYYQGYINYPRTDTRKAEFEPIYPLDVVKEFKGTVREKNVYQMIIDAHNAWQEDRNYIDEGNWVLKNGKEVITSKKDYKTPDMPNIYTKDAFDVKVNREGTSYSYMVEFLEENEIGRPATRTSTLSQMKSAGIIKVIDQKYVVDSRGVVFASAYDYFLNNSWSALSLVKEIDNAKSKEKIASILQKIQPLNINLFRSDIIKDSQEQLEAQKDLAVLDGF